MPKPVNGQASWPQSLEEKYALREDLLTKLQTVQSEISSLELVMLMQELPLGEQTNGESTTR